VNSDDARTNDRMAEKTAAFNKKEMNGALLWIESQKNSWRKTLLIKFSSKKEDQFRLLSQNTLEPYKSLEERDSTGVSNLFN